MNFEEYVLERRRLFELQPEPKAPRTLLHTAIALGAETGEVQSIIEKAYRTNSGNLSGVDRWNLIDEIGDVMWECDLICQLIDVDTSIVFQKNITKLKERHKLA